MSTEPLSPDGTSNKSQEKERPWTPATTRYAAAGKATCQDVTLFPLEQAPEMMAGNPSFDRSIVCEQDDNEPPTRGPAPSAPLPPLPSPEP
jgi:hypothetical protein